MPGQLRKSARCPVCGDGLLALTDLTTPGGFVTREYFHEKLGKARRKRRCVRKFTDYEYDKACTERRRLEVPQRAHAGKSQATK